jgi:hypothetical protein
MAERGAGLPRYSLVPTTIDVRYRGAMASQTNGSGWFGPLDPLKPSAPPEVAGRTWDFPSAYNLATTPKAYEAVTFDTLRRLADGYDLLRTIIETRKDQIERMEWSIKARKTNTKAKVEKDSAAKPVEGADAVEAFFQRPDGYHNFSGWIRLLLEDLFVLDAPALYVQRSIGGQMLSLHPLDGATIKRVIDDWGRTPTMPVDGKLPTAYQQVLKGYPAIDYTVADLIYRPRNSRTNRAYGYSPCEQIIMTVNIALRRQVFLLNYYTEGNIPEALIGVPDTWTPDQVAKWQEYWDNTFTGDLGARRRAKFVPGGMGKTFVTTKEPELKNEFDEWLARVCCFAFSVSPTPFIKQMNRATGETQKEQSDQEGLAPILMWVKSLIDYIIVTEFKRTDLEFAWGEDIQIDPVDEEKVLTGYVNSGQITRNQSREIRGLDPDSDPNANILMITTPQGAVPLSAYQDTQDRADANAAAAADALAAGSATGGADGGGGSNDGRGVVSDAADGGNRGSEGKDKAAAIAKGFTKRARRLAPLPFDRKATRKAIAGMTHTIKIALTKTGTDVAKQVRKELDNLGKAEGDDEANKIAQEIADALDLSGLQTIATSLGIDLSEVAADAVTEAIAMIGVKDASDLVNQVNERAVAVAKDRAAELVGMKYNAAGVLVENPNAEWAITDSTRDMLRSTIEQGLADNIGTDEIAANIEESFAFSAERADIIARTEVARANSTAALEGYIGARDQTGLIIKKEWLLGPNPCVVCEGNADDGAIELEAEFSSGDDAPPAHPECECALSPIVEDDGRADETSNE